MMSFTESCTPLLRNLPVLPTLPRPRCLFSHTTCLLALALLGGCVVAPIGPPRPMLRVATPLPQLPPAVAAKPLYFYPARAQTEALQDRDRYECYRWAVRETGTDPGMTPVRSAPVRLSQATPRRANGGDILGGAATGALLGAALSSPRNAGPNAVLGAIFGAAVGAAAGEARNRNIDVAESRQLAALARANAPQDSFHRAVSRCMQGRGYSAQ